jgi:protein-disulfide isomerase
VSRWIGCALTGWLVACGVQPNETVAAQSAIVAAWSAGSISLAELEAGVEMELREMESRKALERYELLQRTLDAAIEERLLEAERKRRDLGSLDELFAAEVDARAGAPTEEELRAAWVQLSAQMPLATYEDALPFLTAQLTEQRRIERRAMFIDELKAAAGLRMELPYPDIPRVEIPIRDHDPTVGAPDAKVVIVQFAELQCFYCRKAAPVIEHLLARHEGDVRVVFKDFPQSGHEAARQGAIASHCAGEQGRYWEMSRRLLDQPDRLNPAALREVATTLGLDLPGWDHCMRDEVWPERIDEDIRDGRIAGVGATPTFFVNGLLVAGAVPYARLDALVDQELSRRGAATAHREPR